MLEAGEHVWTSDGWRATALVWIDETLAAHGIARTGEVEQTRVRPWSTILRVPTAGGPVWFKAMGANNAFEVGLYEILADVVPEYVLLPIGTDTDRGWMILPDGGPLLADQEDVDLVAASMEMVATYARLQRIVEPHVSHLIDVGVEDMRPMIMPERFDRAVDVASAYVAAEGTDDQKATLERVAATRPVYVQWCERLASLPGRASIDHNDLHRRNVLIRTPNSAADVRFYDWGDAVIAHPFACMLVPLAVLCGQLDTTVEDPRVVRVRDAYLGEFADLGRHDELVEALEFACRVAKVARALVWHRAVEYATTQRQDLSAPYETLASILSESYVR